MNIFALLKNTLKVKSITDLCSYIGQNTPSQPQAPYVTYRMYNAKKDFGADSTEQIRKYYIQVDIYSNTDFISLDTEIKRAMVNTGFSLADEGILGDETYKAHYYTRWTISLESDIKSLLNK